MGVNIKFPKPLIDLLYAEQLDPSSMAVSLLLINHQICKKGVVSQEENKCLNFLCKKEHGIEFLTQRYYVKEKEAKEKKVKREKVRVRNWNNMGKREIHGEGNKNEQRTFKNNNVDFFKVSAI